MHFFRSLMREVDLLVFPSICLCCDQPYADDDQPESFCSSCRRELFHESRESCPRCSSTIGPHTDTSDGCPRCRSLTFHFDSAIRLGPYDGRLRETVLKIKHLPGESLAESLGRVWSSNEKLRSLKLDAIVPIPLHWRRRFSRGFNQSEAIARGLSAGLNVPCRNRWLKRITLSPMQTAVARGERAYNVKGAFRCQTPCQNLRVLLVDDVLTTGATASEAAKVLKQSGAAQVTVAVLAHESSTNQ